MKKFLFLLTCNLIAFIGANALSLSVTTEPAIPGCAGKIHITISSPCGGAYKVGGGYFLNGVLTFDVSPGTYSYTFFDACCLSTDPVTGECLSEQYDIQTITATVAQAPCIVSSSVEVLSHAGPFSCNQGQVKVIANSNVCGTIWTLLLRNGVPYNVHLATSPSIDTFYFSNLYEGNYALVSYNNFCIGDTSYFTITQDPCEIEYTTISTNTLAGLPLCNTGSITFQSYSPSCAYAYHNALLMKDGVPFLDGYFYPESTDITYPQLGAGSYQIVVRVGEVCYDTSEVIIIQNSPCDLNVVLDSTYQINGVCNSGKIFFTNATSSCHYHTTALYKDGVIYVDMLTWASNFVFQGLPDGNYTLVSYDGYCTDTLSNVVINACANTNYQVKLLLEGFYNGFGGLVPAEYNQGVIEYPLFCDTVDVLFMNPSNLQQIVHQQKGLLQLDGTLALTLPNSMFNNNYYIALKHRNSIETWSAAPVTITQQGIYDFSSASSKAFGANQSSVLNGYWALYTGDINQDGVVDGLDYNDWESDNNNFSAGYLATDLNGDGIVDGLDFLLWEVNNNGFVGAVVP